MYPLTIPPLSGSSFLKQVIEKQVDDPIYLPGNNGEDTIRASHLAGKSSDLKTETRKLNPTPCTDNTWCTEPLWFGKNTTNLP
jgi:hypothetical protein